MLRRGAQVGLLLLLALASSGCGGGGSGKKWNVLLVTFDTTRADRLHCYGNEHVLTPNLDGLAAEGIRFARSMSAVPITAPSHSTIHTGLYSIAHGVRDNGLFVLGEKQVTLAEILHEHGYATAGAVGAFPVTSRFGFSQGFDLFDDHLTGGFEDYLGQRAIPKGRLFFDERRAAQVNEAVLPWISEHAKDPFFVWVHYFDPHQPFEPPPPYDQLYADDLYDGEIAYADSRLGFLLDHLRQLGVLENTLVVMTADHGEGLGEHNEITHAVLAYNSTLHVPLIVRPPAGVAPKGKVVETRVGSVDIVPTVLDLLGLEAPENLQGNSLVPLWQEGATDADAPRRYAVRYAENISSRLTHGWGELRILFDGSMKYIHGPRSELYDLDADPHELHDLIAERPEEAARLREMLATFLERNAVSGVSTIENLDEETRQRLASLGYLHSAGTSSERIVEKLLEGGIAPQDRVGDVNDLSAAKHLLFSHRLAEALVYTQRLLKGDPNSPVYLELHAAALAELGRLDEAWAVVERWRSFGQVPEPTLVQLTALRFEKTKDPATLEVLRQQLKTTPTASGLWALALLDKKIGNLEESRALLDEALVVDPGFAPARVELAIQLAQVGEIGAEGEFLRALQDAPYYPQASYNYGTFLLREGRFDEAAGYFSRAIAIAPRYLKAHLALVAAHLSAQKGDEAKAALTELRKLAARSSEAEEAAQLVAESEAPVS